MMLRATTGNGGRSGRAAGRIAGAFLSPSRGPRDPPSARFHDVILMIAPSGIYIGKAAYPHQYREYDEWK